MRLAELQRAMQTSVLHGEVSAASLVRGTQAFAADARLQVYENAFHQRLVAALTVTYPALHAVLGEAQFSALVREFAQHSPPRHFSIRYFGHELDALLARGPARRKAMGLSDLARWEWSLAAAFDAADAEALTRDALASIEPALWGRLQFQLTPSLQRLQLTSNAVQWWRFATQDAPRPSRWRIAQPRCWALWRAGLSTLFRSLDRDEAQALDAIARGQTFADMCDGLADVHGGSAPLRAAMLLQAWLQHGWIATAQHD